MAVGAENINIKDVLSRAEELDLSVEDLFRSHEEIKKEIDKKGALNIGSFDFLARKAIKAVFGEEIGVITQEHLEVFAKILHQIKSEILDNDSRKKFFPPFPEGEKGKKDTESFPFQKEMEEKDNIQKEKQENLRDTIELQLQAIKRTVELNKQHDSLVILALCHERDYVAYSDLIDKVTQINKVLGKRYANSSLRQAVSRVGNDTNIVEKKVSRDVRYFRLLPEVRDEICETFTKLLEHEQAKKGLKSLDGGDRKAMIEAFKTFILSYTEGNGEKIYREKLASLLTEESKKSLEIDFVHLSSVLERIPKKLLEEPEEVISAAEDAVELILKEEFFKDNPPHIHVRFYNLPKTLEPRFVSPEHINRFIQVRGVVTRLSSIEPFISEAVFVCRDCGNEMPRIQREYSLKLERPVKCNACGSKSIELNPEKSTFRKYQSATIQDLPERLKGGQLPRQLNVILLDDLCDTITPGDRVIMSGTLRLIEGEEENKPVRKVVLIVNHVEKESKDEEDIKITPEEERRILEEVKSPDYKKKLIQSFAPTVHGYENEKLGILLSLFGGHDEYSPAGERKRKRIHVLLIGDPGTAKSHLLDFTARIAPRAVRASGKGASGVGLMAAAKKDNITGRWTVDAGTLVLADNGFAIIDELDKMSKEDRNSLHEPMEQGSVYFAKAGLNMVLNARATVIAAANPKFGKINRNKTIPEQIDLPPSLMSRFDLIFTFINTVDEEKDQLVAEAILKRWYEGERVRPPYSPEFMRKLIVYARKKIKATRLDPQLKEEIQKYYAELRKRLKNKEGFSITPRQLEAILRLAEAHARMHLRDTVTKEDFDVAVNLLEYSLQKAAIDEEGDIDVSILEIGQSSKRRNLKQRVLEVIEKLQDSGEWGASREDIIEEVQQFGFKRVEVEKALRELMESGEVYQPKGGYYKINPEEN
ncbi:minichromosome maintenance protein MCM [Thermococcus nautili]|uniref:DNA replication licensing factor MCM2 n=1 Tax=Thermococcus nautili TaxID=195522 RepID=W8NU68_9EURY|nr:minichromosome maintenance protein MCM [Thermococcus nautili]AHL22798.1 putative ATPase involved in replication control, Cdc46/Mcm family [Thermococcus nautili]CAI1492872.1 DNA replication licensing factor MCM2 [Thermococcus nautili]